MNLTIGQKVAYPGQGVCLVEDRASCRLANTTIDGYTLRVLGDNSTIFVPHSNANSVGIRPVIGRSQCKKLIAVLSADFPGPSADWKARSRDFMEKLQSGDVFAAADVFKKLTYLSKEKKLSFREQTMLEKARFLIHSEIANCGEEFRGSVDEEIIRLVERACKKHRDNLPPEELAAVH